MESQKGWDSERREKEKRRERERERERDGALADFLKL